MRKWVILSVLLGGILRLWLMPTTFHPDIRGHNLAGFLITVAGHPLDFYDYIGSLPRTDPMVKLYGDDLFIYPPLAYWVHALWLKIPLYSPELLQKLFSDMEHALVDPGIGQLLLFLKMPYLLADIVCLWLLTKIVDVKQRSLAIILWMANVPLIYSAYMLGQFDVFIVLFILLALYWAKIHRYGSASVALAVSAGFKPMGLFLLPFLPGNKVKNILVGLATYGLIIAPYALTSSAFRLYALTAQQSDKIWYAKILVSGSQYLPIFMVGCVFLFWISLKSQKSLPWWGWLMSPLLLFFAVVNYHPQWFAWISPFLVLAFIFKPEARWNILTILGLHLALLLSFDNSLNFGLFGLKYSLHKILTDQNVSILRGIMAGTCLSFPWFIKEG